MNHCQLAFSAVHPFIVLLYSALSARDQASCKEQVITCEQRSRVWEKTLLPPPAACGRGLCPFPRRPWEGKMWVHLCVCCECVCVMCVHVRVCPRVCVCGVCMCVMCVVCTCACVVCVWVHMCGMCVHVRVCGVYVCLCGVCLCACVSCAMLCT